LVRILAPLVYDVRLFMAGRSLWRIREYSALALVVSQLVWISSLSGKLNDYNVN
jgi:hypothetical protein